MTIRYIPEGDIFKANQLWGEGRHQLSILKNLMSFGDLQQDQRTVPFADGTIIKCLSCFGQDVINIYVPQVFVGGAPEYRERTIIRYYPAIEVHDIDDDYMGFVLCKGGGFNPPYEYIEKDSLPVDQIWEPAEKRYKERNWIDIGTKGARKIKDIVPSGVAQISRTQTEGATGERNRTGGYVDLLTHCKREWDLGGPVLPEHWRYAAEARPHYEYFQIDSTITPYQLTYNPPDDPWTYVTLGMPQDFYDKYENNYSWNFTEWSPTMVTEIVQHAIKQICEGEIMGFPICWWVVDDVGVTFDTAIAETQSRIIWDEVYVFADNYSSCATTPNFCEGVNSNNHTNTVEIPWDSANGSAMGGNHYATVYSMYSKEYIHNYHSQMQDLIACIYLSWAEYDLPADCYCPSDSITDKETTTIFEGPLEVVVDNVVFEIAPRAEQSVSPRLQSSNIKYFKLGEEAGKSIGMFFLKKNYAAPYDYMYVYASVPGKDEAIITEVEWEGSRHLIPDVKAHIDGEDIDLYGYGSFRLIRVEQTIKEMATAEQPGLFREIIE